MGKVTFGEFSEGGGNRITAKDHDNSKVRVSSALYERIHKDEFTMNSGKVVPARDYTAAVLLVTLPDSADPDAEFRMELGCGKVLLPSDDGTYLDDREAKTPKERLVNKNAAFAVFLQSCERAGAEDGTFDETSRQAIEDNIGNIAGMEFHLSTEEKDGPEGKYKALVASRVYEFGGASQDEEVDEEPADPDMDVIEEKVKALLALPKNKAGLLPSEILKGLVGLSKVQGKKAGDAFQNKDWIEAAIEQGLFKRDAKTKKIVKA